jgi:hypothetical protein
MARRGNRVAISLMQKRQHIPAMIGSWDALHKDQKILNVAFVVSCQHAGCESVVKAPVKLMRDVKAAQINQVWITTFIEVAVFRCWEADERFGDVCTSRDDEVIGLDEEDLAKLVQNILLGKLWHYALRAAYLHNIT